MLGGGTGLLIEAKAASAFGSNAATGFNQEAVQDLVARLFPIVSPRSAARPLARTTLTNKPHGRAGLTWQDVAQVADAADIGTFAHAALIRATQVVA